MTIKYVTTGAWGAGTGSPLDPDEIDENFWDLDQRVSDIEDNPVEPIEPVSMTLEGTQFTMGLSNGNTLGPITVPLVLPTWRGPWEPLTTYSQLDYFVSPDGELGAVLVDHVSAATFSWAATTGSPPVAVYKLISASAGTTSGTFADLSDVILTAVADGDIPVYNDATSSWLNRTPTDVTALLDAVTGDTGSGGVKGLVPAPGSGDAAAGKFLSAGGTWEIPDGGGGGATSLAGLSDVSIAGPSNLSLLQYKASDGKWHNAPLSSVGGTITGVTAGAGLTGGGVSGSVSLAFDAVSDKRILANISGSSAAASANTLTQILDAIAGATRGSVLRRDATGWTILAPGTAGQYLKTGGTGADPSWDTPTGLGTITEVTAGDGLTGGGVSGSVELALDSVADQRLLANISGGAAAPIENSLTDILDDILGGNRGQIIYRGAAAWLALQPGTSGWFLKTNGVGADPIWAKINGNGGGGAVGTTATIWNLSADLATATALPACTYANGTAGVGATLTGNSTGALSVDGVAVSVADRILVKDQSNLAHNGIYAVTTAGSGGAAFVLTRATDFDQTSEILDGSAVYVSGGDVNAGSAWVQITGGGITVGTTSIEFEAITAAMPICAEGEVLGNPQSYDAPAIPTDLARMLRASLGDGTAGQVITSGGTGVDPTWDDQAGGGDVNGPGSSTTGNLPAFADTTGALLSDSGIAAADVLVDADIGATVAPATSGTALLKGDGSGGFSSASAGTDYADAPSGSANTPLFNDGSGGFANGTRSGNTTEVVTWTGSKTTGHLLVLDASGNAIDGGAVPSGGSGGVGDVTGGSASADGELAAYDGTGGKTLKRSYAAFAGPASTIKTYTLPNASATILTDNTAVTVGQGGTGATSASGTALDNISGFASTGIIARTGSGTYAFRTVTGPAAGISVSNGDGVSGNPTLALANDLSALEGLSSTGIAARTGADTWAQRTVTGTANRITITNGDGVSGDPTVDIHASYVGQNTITTLGTIGTGTWQGSVIGASYGGAGTVNGILKANGSGTVSAASAGTDYVAPTGAGLVINLLLPIAGVMTNGELLVPPTIIPACSFPSGASGSYGISNVAATGSATITVKKNGVSFATFAWSASGTTATVTISSTTSFNGTSDTLSIAGPATADATLADIGINLAGTRA